MTNNEEGTKIVSLQSTIGNSEKKRENTKVEVKLSDNTQNSQGSDLGQGIKKETTNEPINKKDLRRKQIRPSRLRRILIMKTSQTKE